MDWYTDGQPKWIIESRIKTKEQKANNNPNRKKEKMFEFSEEIKKQVWTSKTK